MQCVCIFNFADVFTVGLYTKKFLPNPLKSTAYIGKI